MICTATIHTSRTMDSYKDRMGWVAKETYICSHVYTVGWCKKRYVGIAKSKYNENSSAVIARFGRVKPWTAVGVSGNCLSP